MRFSTVALCLGLGLSVVSFTAEAARSDTRADARESRSSSRPTANRPQFTPIPNASRTGTSARRGAPRHRAPDTSRGRVRPSALSGARRRAEACRTHERHGHLIVIEGKAPDRLLDSYSQERTFAADENLMNSTRSTDFITPKSKTSLTFRNAVLALAREHAFARALVNSGRLSVATYLTESLLNTPDTAIFKSNMVPGAAMDDAPMRENGEDFWLVDRVGNQFMALVYVINATTLDPTIEQKIKELRQSPIPLQVVLVSPSPCDNTANIRIFHDHRGRFLERYDSAPGTTYLMRPDQHVAARWRAFDVSQVLEAVARATLNSTAGA